MRQSHRTASIIAGIYTLLQALIYTIFSIYGCAIYTCLATFPFSVDSNHKESDLLYLAYFKGKCRALVGQPQVEADSATRTYYFLIVYGIASAVWIPTSTLLVVASVSRVKGRQGALLFYPWIVNTIILVLMDVVGGVWYGLDITKTLTVTEFLAFLGSQVGPVPSGIDGITVAPAIIMGAVFLRGIVFWIINVIFLGVVIQAAREVKKTFSTSEFIKGSTPKSIQKQMDQEAEANAKPNEAEVRWVRVNNEVILPRLEMVEPMPEPQQQPQQYPQQQPRQQVPHEYPSSPQSPIGPDAPSPVIKRRPSLRRTGSSPVFDVTGAPTGETFPFPQDPNRRYIVNNPPIRMDPDSIERSREDREREMSWERAQERETERDMARRRELERERQDREFQRMRGGSVEGSPRDARRRGAGDDEEMLNNQRPWQYVRPTDLNLRPKYDRTMKPSPRFAPEVPPKPAIPPPDYTASPAVGRNKWDPTNLSRANSNAAYPERWNPRRAY
uniref:Uncharacterized protein n=6 Tax=Lygus hesperus TaxID=30085 RepID=A0A0A9ZB34_LYGHE